MTILVLIQEFSKFQRVAIDPPLAPKYCVVHITRKGDGREETKTIVCVPRHTVK